MKNCMKRKRFCIIVIAITAVTIAYKAHYPAKDTNLTKRDASRVVPAHDTGDLNNFDVVPNGVRKHKETLVSGFDIVRAAPFKFLPNFKNPCWIEHYTGKNVYDNNAYVIKDYSQWNLYGKALINLPPGGAKIELENGICNKEPHNVCRLRCLPYFMLIGVAKSGTTDLYTRIIQHPQIFDPCSKELYWWSQYRHTIAATLGDYADLFDCKINHLIYNRKDENNYHQSILGDFTSMTFFDFAHWRSDPRNRNMLEPKVTLVDDLREVLPNVKLIVILRNPTDRLYSSYNMFKTDATPKNFHKKVLGSIQWWDTCVKVKKLQPRNCANGSPPEMPPVYDQVGDSSKRWYAKVNYTGEIRIGMYALFIKDWLAVFPKESFLFLRMEDYGKYVEKAFVDEILPFLNVSSKIMHREAFRSTPVNNRNYRPMLEETKTLLDEFYSPFNLELSRILQDEKWLWKEYTANYDYG